MNSSLRSCLAVFLAVTGALTLRADPAAVIARARAYLGGDAALNAVKSIQFEGHYLDESDDTKRQAAVEMIFQKPYFHRVVMTGNTNIETTGLDGYEGWMRVQEVKDPTHIRLAYLTKDQIKGLRTNVWETLNFYAGIEARGGRVIDLGEVVIDNIVCDKLGFEHEPGLYFRRSFERATGRLVLTETSQGTSREEGSVIVNGVRFPKKIVTTVKTNGKDRTISYTFDTVKVNEVFPGAMFIVPPIPVPQFTMPVLPGSPATGAQSAPAIKPMNSSAAPSAPLVPAKTP